MASMQGSSNNPAVAMQHAAFPRLESMWREGKGCDVTIMCKHDQAIKAHSLVLCSVSDKLDELLLLNADKMINSLEVEAEIWEALLEVIYTGQFYQTDDLKDTIKLENMLSVAQSLGMNNIVDMCKHRITEKCFIDTETGKDTVTEEHCNDETPDAFEDVEPDIGIPEDTKENLRKTSTRKKKCLHCKERCRAKKVKCSYCFKIVENDTSHMDKCHPFTPASSMFVFSCRFSASESASKDWVVFTKILTEQGVLLQCSRCDMHKPSLEEIIKHLSSDHGITARVCKVCHTGFMRKVFVKDHENFCKGGDLLKCDECGKEVGGFHAFWSHMAQHRNGGHFKRKGKLNREDINTVSTENNENQDAFSESAMASESENTQVTPIRSSRTKVCVNCTESCPNKWVKCVYCERIVFNSARHMDQVHPFSPKTCMWAYYCKYQVSKDDHNKVSHVCSKEAIGGNESTLKHVCQKCKVSYKTLNMIDKHLKVKHHINNVYHCVTCDMGFSSFPQLDDHTHFCEGRDLSLFCSSKTLSKVEDDFAGNMSSGGKHDMQTRYGAARPLRREIKKPVRFRETVNNFDENEDEDGGEGLTELPDIKLHSVDSVSTEEDMCDKQTAENSEENTGILLNDRSEDPELCEINDNKLKIIKAVNEANFNDREVSAEQLVTNPARITGNLSVSRRKSLCTSCGESCRAEYVQCLYCFRTTGRDSSHMTEEHAFTPATSYWVYSCKAAISQENVNNENILLFKKELSSFNAEHSHHYQCLLCDQKIEDHLDEVILHIKTQHNMEPFVCRACEAGFSTSSMHENHELFCTGEEPSKCSICGQYFGKLEALMLHKTNVHKDIIATENPQESNAGKEIPVESSVQSIHNPLALISEITVTQEVQEKGSSLKRKVKQEEQQDFSNGVCTNCGESCKAVTVRCLYCFKVVDKDITHKEIGHPHSPSESLWVYTCQLEPDEQLSQAMIFIKESVHKKPSAFRKTQKQGKTEKFKCLQCDNNFKSMEILLKHVVHQFRCLKCMLIFTNKDSVTRHVELRHNQTAYRCEVCLCGFVDQSCYEDHTHLCGGGGLMTCSACSISFWRVTDFTQHTNQCQPEKRVKLEESKEDSSVAAVTSDPDDEEFEEEETGDPLFTVEEPMRKVRRGRPRKRGPGKGTSAGKSVKQSLAPSDESLESSLGPHFEEVPSVRERAHMKMCLACGDRCLAEAVKCGYCGGLVKEEEMDNHMTLNHPMVPATSLWVVTCRCYRVSNQEEHLARQIIEHQQVTNENNMTEDGVFMSLLAGYECVVCDQRFTGDDILQHLLGEHKIEASMCETCGLVIKSDGKINVHDHKHICAGGEILKCKDCDKRFASWQSANKHRKMVHMETKRNRRTTRPSAPTEVLETQGEHGYLIKCVDCDGTCHMGDVKCGLCLEIVPKNDLHMKLKHAYSPTSTWVVTCKYSIPTTENQLRGFAGGKVAACNESELLAHQHVPCIIDFHYKCFWCDSLFSNKKQFKDHVRLMHFKTMEHRSTGLVVFYCKHCEAVLIGRSYFFSDHVQFCSKGEVYQCEHCELQFCYLQKLHLHLKKKHPEAVEKRRALRAAAVRSSGKVPIDIPAGTVLQCAECPFTTENLTLLKRHNRLEHKYKGGQLHQLCRFCYKVFRVRSDRERHEQTEHLGGQDVVCHICGLSYEIPNQLERHMYYYHKGGREYLSVKQKEDRKKNVMKICKYCGKEYTIAAKLNRHIRVVHEKTLAFKCSMCRKEYGSRDSLRIHENKHRGNKPYSCPYCTYKDYRGYIVNSHVEREHPGREKPYKRVSVFQAGGEGVLEEGEGGFEPQQLVVEYVKATGQEEEYTTAEVIQLPNYTIQAGDEQQHFVEAVQRYEVTQDGSEVQIPSQQIEVKEVALDSLEEVTTAGEVLMEYYVT